MNLLDHLSDADRETYLDKLARYTAEALAKQQQESLVYEGQSAIAARLKCSRATAGKLLAEQKIFFTRLNKKGYRVTEAAILAYLQAA